MEAFFIFIAKSSGLVILFYCAYYFLLRKETFFNSSRWFLLAGLITSVVLPFLVYTKIIWIEPAPIVQAPVMAASKATIAAMDYSKAYIVPAVAEDPFEINWNYVVLAVYGIGFLALVIKFMIDFYSLNSVLKGKKVLQQADFKFVDINENIAPFSYFDYIVYNSSMYTASELESILEHEKVHSDQNHTMDVLISRVFCVLFWFNPFIWLYKKAILQNLEFIADSEAAKIITDKKAYQYTLLKITAHESCVAITNHFYQSLIKKRIVMLNKNQSKKWNYWKYYAIIPALAAFIFLFQIKTIAQEKEAKEVRESKGVIKNNDSTDVIKIQKNTTDQELKKITEDLKQKHNVDVVISDVKRNSENELTAIKVDVKRQNGKTQTIHIESNKAIKGCGIVVSTQNNGFKNVALITDDAPSTPRIFRNQVAERDEINDTDGAPLAPPTPPTPPTPPSYPIGAMPQMPSLDVPMPPMPPMNPGSKADMAKFKKDMAEYEKKIKSIEPGIAAYEKQINEFLGQKNSIYEKEMQKYEAAMDKFSAEMDKFAQDIEGKYGKDSKEYDINMKQYEEDMKQHEQHMLRYEVDMKKHEKEMKRHEKEMKKLEKESRKS
ncbi:M56 family metallopeptidase [Flavobacterium tructae]|uniref:Peptidase M56 n=1 Tax=Flavobacterium tructae TaxID=1114873 RepID=A0A1S1J301_9FLAO|nr:M56 family metallopeptidase [Flavobacterium tructae]OHT44011.1 peptidase M56 [Flavobacterium tructae]OXB20351.1 peptidase M56 [Flavobacterium tructae]